MTTQAAPALSEPSAADMRLVIGASSLGTVFEWYDFLIYGTLATIIGKAFVPSDNELVRQLVVWAGFAVGFGFRPLGAVLFGYLGDRLGRKPAMVFSFTLMGVSILGLALTPPHSMIGFAAPVLAIFFRMVQGFALGGEVGPTTAFLLDAAPP